jgi:hypothetical protein
MTLIKTKRIKNRKRKDSFNLVPVNYPARGLTDWPGKTAALDWLAGAAPVAGE